MVQTDQLLCQLGKDDVVESVSVMLDGVLKGDSAHKTSASESYKRYVR